MQRTERAKRLAYLRRLKRRAYLDIIGWMEMIQYQGSWGGHNLRWNKRVRPKR